MKCYEIFRFIEDWAPKGIAWDKDNVGLQVGSADNVLKNILLCLDLNDKVVDEAVKKNCSLIVSHHPLLFRPLKKIDTQSDKTSRIIEKLFKHNITLYSAHTNLDFTKDGVSFKLAEKLNLKNSTFLQNLSSNQFKLSVFVPFTHIDEVAEAIHNAGGGVIGEYTHCSFRTIGTGTFKGSAKSNPRLGKKTNLEYVDEVKLEVLIDSFNSSKIISAMINAHPYEEVAYDLYPLANENINYGMGVLGYLEQPMNEKDFLNYVYKSLKIKNFRYTKGKNNKIKKVAVCGGSGSDLLLTAINKKADAFITADVKYHSFDDAQHEILLIDAGHYETEIFSLDEVEKKLKKFLSNKKNKVFKYTGTTNPIKFYNI
ncbi:MAG: Nif3-like dinuclear metal center hexameric protein [Ignavibacteriaceae bacterium]|nr:Nif3-like dinuclear metal center hexameric protein [Ignavibacteriaceae bacterium]